MSRLDEIAEREKRATPGEWVADCHMTSRRNWFIKQPEAGYRILATCELANRFGMPHHPRHDFDFIAHARQDVPWMLANVRAAIAHIDATLTKHAGDIPRGELVRVWDLLEGRVKATEVSDGR